MKSLAFLGGIGESISASKQVKAEQAKLSVMAGKKELPMVLVAWLGNPADGMAGIAEGKRGADWMVRLDFSGAVIQVPEAHLVQTGIKVIAAAEGFAVGQQVKDTSVDSGQAGEVVECGTFGDLSKKHQVEGLYSEEQLASKGVGDQSPACVVKSPAGGTNVVPEVFLVKASQKPDGFEVGNRVSDGQDEGVVVAVAATPKELVKKNQEYLIPVTTLEGLLPAERFEGGGGGNILDSSVDPILVFRTDDDRLVAVFVHEAEKPLEASLKVAAAEPAASPAVPSRGTAPQKDALQKKARENVVEKVVDPSKLETVKPDKLPIDKARVAPQASGVIKTLLDRVHVLESDIKAKGVKIKEFRDSLNLEAVITEYKTKAKELFEEIEATGEVVLKVNEVFLAIDVSREVTEANMSDETKREKKKLETSLEKAEAKVATIGEEIEALEASSFTRMGGTETVQRRVTEFKDPAKKNKVESSLIAWLSVSPTDEPGKLRLAAGLKEMFAKVITMAKDLAGDLKGIFTDANGFMKAFKKDVAAAEKAPKAEPTAQPAVAASAVLAGEDGNNRFINHYHCPDCNETWEDASENTNDDECPKCGKAYTPESSEDIPAASPKVEAGSGPAVKAAAEGYATAHVTLVWYVKGDQAAVQAAVDEGLFYCSMGDNGEDDDGQEEHNQYDGVFPGEDGCVATVKPAANGLIEVRLEADVEVEERVKDHLWLSPAAIEDETEFKSLDPQGKPVADDVPFEWGVTVSEGKPAEKPKDEKPAKAGKPKAPQSKGKRVSDFKVGDTVVDEEENSVEVVEKGTDKQHGDWLEVEFTDGDRTRYWDNSPGLPDVSQNHTVSELKLDIEASLKAGKSLLASLDEKELLAALKEMLECFEDFEDMSDSHNAKQDAVGRARYLVDQAEKEKGKPGKGLKASTYDSRLEEELSILRSEGTVEELQQEISDSEAAMRIMVAGSPEYYDLEDKVAKMKEILKEKQGVQGGPDVKAAAKGFDVWNETDGVPAAKETFPTVEAARAWVKGKRRQIAEQQGHYRDNGGRSLDPAEVEYLILKSGAGLTGPTQKNFVEAVELDEEEKQEMFKRLGITGPDDGEVTAAILKLRARLATKAYSVPPSAAEPGYNFENNKAADKQMREEFRRALLPLAREIGQKLNSMPKIGEHPYEKQSMLEELVKILKEAI